MNLKEAITFVIPINDNKVFENIFLASPLFYEDNPHQILAQRNFRSAAEACNSGINKAENDLIIFSHQDVYFPESWLTDLKRALKYLEIEDPKWGVLGCFGSAKGRPGGVGRVFTTGLGIHGNKIDRPEPVETVDEIVIIIRKSSGLRFDASLPHFHLYGADICMSAKEKGMMCYAIPAFCIHNTNQLINLPKEFYECYFYIKKRWKKYLPIYTSCIKISQYNEEIYKRKLKYMFNKILGRIKPGKRRIADPMEIMKQI